MTLTLLQMMMRTLAADVAASTGLCQLEQAE